MDSGINAARQRRILRRLLPGLPPGAGLMLMGNTASLRHGVSHVTRTKDVDVSILVLDPSRRIAPVGAVHAVLDALNVEPASAPDDGSWVKAFIDVHETSYQVDFIRGKSRDRPNGTFIDRRTLNTIVEAAAPDGDVHLPSLTDLILMKAWAATDQTRYLRQEPADASWHQDRQRAYRDDVRRLTEHALDRDLLDRRRLTDHLVQMARHRRTEVQTELVRAGSLEPDERSDEDETRKRGQ